MQQLIIKGRVEIVQMVQIVKYMYYYDTGLKVMENPKVMNNG